MTGGIYKPIRERRVIQVSKLVTVADTTDHPCLKLPIPSGTLHVGAWKRGSRLLKDSLVSGKKKIAHIAIAVAYIAIAAAIVSLLCNNLKVFGYQQKGIWNDVLSGIGTEIPQFNGIGHLSIAVFVENYWADTERSGFIGYADPRPLGKPHGISGDIYLLIEEPQTEQSYGGGAESYPIEAARKPELFLSIELFGAILL